MSTQTINTIIILLFMLACIRAPGGVRRVQDPQDYQANMASLNFYEGRQTIPRNGLSLQDLNALVALDYHLAKITIDQSLIDLLFPNVNKADQRFITDSNLGRHVSLAYLTILDFFGIRMIHPVTGVLAKDQTWKERKKNLIQRNGLLPQIISFLTLIKMADYARQLVQFLLVTFHRTQATDQTGQQRRQQRSGVLAQRSLEDMIDKIDIIQRGMSNDLPQSALYAAIADQQTTIYLNNQMQRRNLNQWLNGEHAVSQPIDNGVMFSVFNWYSGQCYGTFAGLPIRETLLRAQSDKFFEHNHRALLGQLFPPIGNGRHQLSDSQLIQMRKSQTVVKQVEVAANIFLSFIGIYISDQQNYQFSLLYDESDPRVKQKYITRFNLVKYHIGHIIVLLKKLELQRFARKLACLFSIEGERFETKQQPLHRHGYLDILPRTTHSYIQFYEGRAMTAIGALSFQRLFEQMQDFGYLTSSHSEASLMFPLKQDSEHQRQLAKDERNLFRADLQLQWNVLSAVKVMMGHMNILFPDDTMPWPKMQFNTDDQRVLKEKVNRLVTAESYQTLLCRMVKFLDNIQLFNYATEVAKMIKELFRKAGQQGKYQQLHRQTIRILQATAQRRRYDDKFVPVTVYLHKADRKNRRARGEYIEQENEDEIILEEAIIFGNSLRRQLRKSKAIDPKDPTSPIQHNVVHIKDRQRRRMHNPRQQYHFEQTDSDGISVRQHSQLIDERGNQHTQIQGRQRHDSQSLRNTQRVPVLHGNNDNSARNRGDQPVANSRIPIAEIPGVLTHI